MRLLHYFAYGSNMSKKRLKERKIIATNPRPAHLSGYRLEFNKVAKCSARVAYANIVIDANSLVEGILYDIDETNLEKLDHFEGCKSGDYKRSKVNVRLSDNQQIIAETYIACLEKLKEGLKPCKEYMCFLFDGKDYLSPNYLRKLEAVETVD